MIEKPRTRSINTETVTKKQRNHK